MAGKKGLGILEGRKVYLPRMTYCGARAFAAALRSVGIDADVTPESDDRTLELGAKFLSGDECFPAKVTIGDLLRLIEQPGFEPRKTAFFMPTADGPCRFGQYVSLVKKILRELGLSEEVAVVSPTSAGAYKDLGEYAGEIKRTGWRALVAADILRKLLLKTRPYELNEGETERVFEECLDELCQVLEKPGLSHKVRIELLREALVRTRDRFRKIPASYTRKKPLIGVVGEIFCRLNTFSNENVVKVVERHGGEAWLSDVAEWVWYTDSETQRILRLDGKRFSLSMLGSKIKTHVQRADEHKLYEPFKHDFLGYEEPESTTEMLKRTAHYLPQSGALGEMVLSVGKSVYLYSKGADGIIDISPFTCMNGITCEAIYPRVSRDCDGIPIKNFYFDGTQADLDRDVAIFMELAKTYQRKKRIERVFPRYFSEGLTLHARTWIGG